MSATAETAAPEFTYNGTRHQYTPVQDTEYLSLFNAACSCGWHSCGYVKDWLALHYWEQHRAEVPRQNAARIAELEEQRDYGNDYGEAEARELDLLTGGDGKPPYLSGHGGFEDFTGGEDARIIRKYNDDTPGIWP